MWEVFPYQPIVALILVVANMKIITSIYLQCRPDLRDEWLTGTEADDAGDAQVRFFVGISCIDPDIYSPRPKNMPFDI